MVTDVPSPDLRTNAAVVPSGSLRRDLLRLLAGPAGKIGMFGIALLLIAFGMTAVNGYRGRVNTTCAVVPGPDQTGSEQFQILQVDPDQWQFSKRVCIIVEGVVPAAQLKKLQDSVSQAEAAVGSAPLPQRAAARAEFLSAQSALTAFTKGFDYRLYVDGQPSTLTAHAAATATPQALTFSVKSEEDATSDNGTFWRTVLAQPTHRGSVPIEIGLAPKEAEAPAKSLSSYTDAGGVKHAITFRLYQPIVMWLAMAGTACLMIGLAGIGYSTTLLRAGKTNTSAYSLSRVQMAFWLVLSTAGFVYVWLVTGEYLNVFPSALFVLIGISGATAGASSAIGSDVVSESRSFLHDIAGDCVGGEVQLHRLQILAWTLILGLIFCWNVVANLELVSFDTNLLLLAGVANGVYLTMKTQEQKELVPVTQSGGP